MCIELLKIKNSCERLLLGTLISDIEIGVEHLRSEHINLTLSNTKRGMDLGTLVVPLDQTFHPLNVFSGSLNTRHGNTEHLNTEHFEVQL